MSKYNRIPDPSDPRNDTATITVIEMVKETDKAYLCEVAIKSGGTSKKWFPKKKVKYKNGVLITTKGFLTYLNTSNNQNKE